LSPEHQMTVGGKDRMRRGRNELAQITSGLRGVATKPNLLEPKSVPRVRATRMDIFKT
jgi:hypothetical protein